MTGAKRINSSKPTSLLINTLYIAILGLLAGCGSGVEPLTDAPTPYQLYIQSMRDKYHGDPTKLTPEERKTMDRYTFHHTDAAMRYIPKPKSKRIPPDTS